MVFVKAGCESNLQLVDVKLVERFKALEAELGKRGAGAMRTALVRSSPSYRVLRLIFNSQEGTQLANLDAALQLTAPLAGSAFLAIAAAPGRFSEYLLWRAGRPVRGWGLCAGPTTAQPFPFLPQCQADGRYATLNAAELGWREADNLVASKFKAGGVGLAIADLPPADSKDEGSPVYQKHLLLNTLLCLRAVQPGGSCVLKLAGLTTELTLQVVWLLRRVFKQLSVIRPFSLGSMSGCVYVVYQNLAQDTRVAVEALTSALEAVERSGGPLQRFLDRSLVEADVRLVDLVRAFNQRLLASRIETVKLALGFVEDSSKPPLGPPTPKMLAYAKLEWALDP
ncbi:Cap-specific mRNA (nucleoside-2'-O-)-methyltransferase 1 [Massospora cicadina]|nr:Cap-specific mRNA (nucleoside-2'-O-)-methyltransferase 1 [Massospora cicadina]